MFDARDQLQAAVDDLLGAPRERGAEALKASRLSGIKELYMLLTGDCDLYGGYYAERAQLSLLSDVLTGNRSLIVSGLSTDEQDEERRLNREARSLRVQADKERQRVSPDAIRLDTLKTALADVDVLVCSTAAPHAVVFVEHVRPALASRGDRPLCILDIALPRDVDPAVGDVANVFLYDIDDLQAVVSANIERRRAELPTAEELIGAEVGKYWDWLAGLAAVPVLTAMRARMDEVRATELADALRHLPQLSEADRAVVEELSKSLMNKFLHEPTVRLRAAASNGRGLGVVDTVRYLFGLERKAKPSDEKPLANTRRPS
jgi:glutamyl-tRNA reductase